jgi:predicted MFS family arabinose efflux permease
MIVVLLAVLGLTVWTYLFWVGLNRLRMERLKAQHVHDRYRLVRNKRAVSMFMTWSLVFAYTLSSVSFLDVGLVEFSRFVRVTESIVIVVCGLWILFGPEERAT